MIFDILITHEELKNISEEEIATVLLKIRAGYWINYQGNLKYVNEADIINKSIEFGFLAKRINRED
jgi:hypothetical protein